jgi:small conductance mechanosensitive channel
MLSKLSITSLGNFDLGKISSESFNINKFLDNCLQIVIILVVMYIAVKLGSKIIEKTLKKQQIMFSIDEKKSKTLIAVLKSILRYTVYFLGIMGIFSTVSLTAASIGGVTVGLASQSLIKDVINGIFILFENQYTVGENVTIEQKSGIVESLELRVTKIRDFNGDLHIIPNGSIKNVTNHSRGNIRIAANICVDYSENIDNVFKTINEACEKFANEAEQDIIEKPKVFGITDFKAIGINVMIVGKVKPSTQGTNEVELRRFIIKELNQNNIKLASNNLEGTGR